MPVIQTGAAYSAFTDTHVIPLPAATTVGSSITLKFYKGSDATSIISVRDSTSTDLTNDLNTSFDTDSSGHWYSIHALPDTPSSVTVILSAAAQITAFIKEITGITSRRPLNDVTATPDGEGFAISHSWEYTANATGDLFEALGGIYGGFVQDTATATGNSVIETGANEFTAVGYEFAAASGAGSLTFDVVTARSCSYAGVVYAAGGGGGGGGGGVIVPVGTPQLNRRTSGRRM